MLKIFESSAIKIKILLLSNILLSILYVSQYGISGYNTITLLSIYFLFMCLGMVITYHRYYAHYSFKFKNNFYKYVCTTLGLLSGSGSVLNWCAVHNKHHDKHDTPEDPHDSSKGLFNLITLNYDYNIELKYFKYLLRDKFLVFSHRYYLCLILIYVICLGFLFGIEGVVFGFSIPSFLVVFVEALTTYFLHKGGKPRYVAWLNWFVFGDGNHDSHHKDLSLYKLERNDLSGWIIHNILRRA
jgi:stearoyl-CoA desaturase (delta-9 desaturase)